MRSLLWGLLCGAAAATALGLVLLRPIRVVVNDPYPPLPIDNESPEPGSTPSQDRDSPPPAPSAPTQPPAQPVSDGALNPSASSTTNPAPPPLPTDRPAGILRVSNQTVHAVRIALLPQSSAASEATGQPGESFTSETFDEPVHWDFAPGEGGTNGLLLSLPDGRQAIQSGDILVAFSQDGSQRYWGPYVVGTTPLPAWQSDGDEWQLTLQTSADASLGNDLPQ